MPLRQPNEPVQAYYFGCYGDGGHYLFGVGMRKTRHRYGDFPFPWQKVDGALAPKLTGGQVQGVAALYHDGGWTALAFWDRTVDTRGGSNSVFFFETTLDFDGAVSLARTLFPQVMKRLDDAGITLRPCKVRRSKADVLAVVAERNNLDPAQVDAVLAEYERALTEYVPEGARAA